MHLRNLFQEDKIKLIDTGKHFEIQEGSIYDVLDAAPVAVHFFDERANLFDCNKAALKMHEMTDKDEFIDNFLMFVPFTQPDGKRSNAALQEMVSNAIAKSYSEATLTYRTADGTQAQANVTCAKMFYNGSLSVIAFSTIEQNTVKLDRDIEADLRANLMLDSTPMACFLADESGIAIDCNAEALQLFGYSSKDSTTAHF